MLRRWYDDASIAEPSGPMPAAERLAAYFGGEPTALDGSTWS